MERGIFLEPFILKKYNLEKNTDFKKPFGYKIYEKEKFKIVGQCDAVDISKSEILEVKTRINIGVTDADRCQVQCYMEMYGAERCRFIELNQEGFLKETLIESKPEEWDRIIQAIERFMNNAHNLGREEILNLLREEEASEMQ
jgi:hypothetical protein